MDDNKFSSCVGWIVSYVVLAVLGVYMDGWALSTIWNWFIPPIFGLVSLTLMQSVGVAMVFSLFTRTNFLKNADTRKQTSLEKFVETAIVAVFTPLFSVAIAWVFLQFAF